MKLNYFNYDSSFIDFDIFVVLVIDLLFALLCPFFPIASASSAGLTARDSLLDS